MSALLTKLRDSAFTRLCLVVLLVLAGSFYFSSAYGEQLPNRSLLIGDARSGATTTYLLGFDIPSSETLGSIELQVCANDPLVGDPCTAPSGFDISTAVLTNQTGAAGFTVLSSATNANTLVLTRIPSTANPGPVSYTLSGVTNPSTGGAYFGRLQTFASPDASGASNDFGGLALNITEAININTTVPPYLLFCTGITITGLDCATASGDYVNFGILSSQTTSNADTQSVVATNADTGFALFIEGTTMTSGNNIINNITTSDVSRPGVSQFGINLVANSTPSIGADPSGPGIAVPTSNYNQPNRYRFIPDEALASAPEPTDYRKLTTSYIVNIPNGQAPGVYVTTLTYVCLANF